MSFGGELCGDVSPAELVSASDAGHSPCGTPTGQGIFHIADAIFDACVQGVSVADASDSNLPLVYVSHAFERLTGYPAAECLGRNCRFLQGPETDRAVVAELRDALRARQTTQVVLLNYRKDGSRFWNQLTVRPVEDQEGRPYIVGLQHDVTHLREMRREVTEARRMLSERQQFTSAVLDGIHAAVVTTDVDGIVTFANRMALSTLALSMEELVGRSAEVALQLPPEARGCFSSKGEGQKRLSYRYQRRDGAQLDIGLSMSRPVGLTNPHGLGHCVIFRDLAEIKQLELDVRRIERLAAMGTMVAGFAHEVRNPVASLRILGEALEAELDERDAKREYLTRMMQQLVRIERLVKTSLRFGCPEPARRAVHAPAAIVAATLDAIVARTKQSGAIRVAMEPHLPTVYVDDAQIVQVLVVLLSNALDAASHPERVELRVCREGTSDRGASGVRFEVSDDGPGIPEHMQTHVFDPFFTTKPNGTGLGLSIAQQLVHENGGRIELCSKLGRGTTFTVLLILGE